MALEFISQFYPIYHDFIPYIVIYIAKMYVKLFITSQTNIINQMNLLETDENCFLIDFSGKFGGKFFIRYRKFGVS